MKFLGLDPGLRNTGWGLIESTGNRLSHIANGVVNSTASFALADRLVQLHDGLVEVIEAMCPDEAAVEETFVNKNPTSTLKLGQARGISLLVPARAGIPVFEYTPNQVKKTVVGAGHAQKEQVQMMVKTLLPGVEIKSADSADALAIAICHAHQRSSIQHQLLAEANG
ncbi:MAG: crossover junction endodeoxyribonuclease RuvC [Rhodospirillaceae bacterium]|jgi:crossover junction endodeoxyribonuclease RuvC|nr:crossover junction endodeoxyribonuclease RuvC [Rhodospirillales bacterium]MBT3905230.1 crossover junction endodeoxyribonuclease RuvC [Rhodospirillaceae bacterium]MBT4699872.1 crossover junction endodeoxyribonuclease RuvC [Rhodospirillaceae bacterium]MBT5033359.1 crossover junction endodeoxyribonuclease RuvC [Rhodospirillaceae bacterium]MBT6219203.1 crossover junction endodeoxyribonuclease RuvC [Rhodospirillaceae bacterium]